MSDPNRPILQYATPTTNLGRIAVESGEHGIRFSTKPLSLIQSFIEFIVALVLVLLPNCCLLGIVIQNWEQGFALHTVITSIVFIVILSIGIMFPISRLRVSRIPTVLALNNGLLVLIVPGVFRRRRWEWPAASIREVRAVRLSDQYSPSLHRLGELEIESEHLHRVSYYPACTFDELNEVAAELNRYLAMPENRQA